MEMVLPKHKDGHTSKNILLKNIAILVAFPRYCQDLFHWNRYELLHKIYLFFPGVQNSESQEGDCVSTIRLEDGQEIEAMVDWAIW